MMAAATRDYRLIWDVAVMRRTRGLIVLFGASLALMFAATLALDRMGDAVGLPSHFGVNVIGRALLTAASAEFLLVWAFAFMPGSALLNSAVNARLLPRQRRRLFQMAVGGWLLGSAGLALGFGAPVVFPLAALWALAASLGSMGYRWVGPVNIALPILPTIVRSRIPPPLLAFLSSPASVAVASAAVLALGWRLLGAHYRDGGDRQMQRAQALAQQLRRFEARGEIKDTFVSRWSQDALYGPALARACRRRDPATLMMHALGPWGHWTMSGVWLASTLLLVGAMVLVPGVAAGTQPGVDSGAALMVLGFMALAVGACTMFMRSQMGKRQGEQALVRLTPLAGNAALMNHRLADALLRTGARQVLVLSVPFCLLALASGGAEALARELALCCVGAQVALAVVLDDFSRPAPRGWIWRPVALAAGEIVLTVGLGAWLGFSGWPWLAAASLAVGAVQVGQGWRRMRKAPPAFPTLRLDTGVEAKR
jgi:hypothetical protein